MLLKEKTIVISWLHGVIVYYTNTKHFSSLKYMKTIISQLILPAKP